ncbi:DUF6705 family protein [Acetobacteroides hydrogenigenes]|uniref:DUF6705 domain-containing protein n=1 Tax=Acetobacteroides hydrogenigenes TaxID=979970 RepID=A0A4V2RN31_9BACT|nr:DUF6705 family protein [Acetobacteroides hydrogenigenes]TCN62130.1 hypothetical protein CLV25_12043 [Acetobacteroides hydrogenigenes]
MIEKALKLLLGGFLVASTLACFGQQPFRYYKQEGAVGRYVGTWQAKTDTSCFTLKLYKCREVFYEYDVEAICGTYEYTLHGEIVHGCLDLPQDTVFNSNSKQPISASNYKSGIPDSVSLGVFFKDPLKGKVTYGKIAIRNGQLEWKIRPYVDHLSLTIDGKPISPPLSEGWSVPIRAILRRVE